MRNIVNICDAKVCWVGPWFLAEVLVDTALVLFLYPHVTIMRPLTNYSMFRPHSRCTKLWLVSSWHLSFVSVAWGHEDIVTPLAFVEILNLIVGRRHIQAIVTQHHWIEIWKQRKTNWTVDLRTQCMWAVSHTSSHSGIKLLPNCLCTGKFWNWGYM